MRNKTLFLGTPFHKILLINYKGKNSDFMVEKHGWKKERKATSDNLEKMFVTCITVKE